MFCRELILLALLLQQSAERTWRRNSLIYQIYPRSFKDTNGNGLGDLNGVISELDHLADLGIDALWLSPIYPSPQVDLGYDVSNYTDIDPSYGTLGDFDRLVAKARKLNLKVILDFVPNHSSNQHEWFEKSVRRIKPYDDYYVWRDGKNVNGSQGPPNNWVSVFGGSAWQFHQLRGQYYFHQCSVGQPDFNYRSPEVHEEMKRILTFWMRRGVDGFRVDSMNVLYEDSRFLDEPASDKPDSPDEFDRLNHIYTIDLPENYRVLQSWRKLMDDYAKEYHADEKIILTEAIAPLDLTMRYYSSGSNVPFNFMFMFPLNKNSSAVNFKLQIDAWLNSMPKNDQYVPNWVTGNHDQHRVANTFGKRGVDQLNMLAMILPGITVIYNGDEIGMEDRFFTWEETQDIAGCVLGPERYHLKSRDPQRTPYQWDNSTSAGFSTNNKTWLAVNENYKSLNLAAQKSASVSHYKIFKKLSALKSKRIIENGTLNVNLVTENILGVVRRLGRSTVVVLINFSEKNVNADVSGWLNVDNELIVYVASIGSNIVEGRLVDLTDFSLPGFASVVLVTPKLL